MSESNSIKRELGIAFHRYGKEEPVARALPLPKKKRTNREKRSVRIDAAAARNRFADGKKSLARGERDEGKRVRSIYTVERK